MIIESIPPLWRRRLAIAGAASLWKNPVFWVINPLLGNGFPLAQDGPIRPSLENMGKIIDNGWSVLIYPEGQLTIGGPIKSFMNGTGLLAVERTTAGRAVKAAYQPAGLANTLPNLQAWLSRDTLWAATKVLARHRLPRGDQRDRGRGKVAVRRGKVRHNLHEVVEVMARRLATDTDDSRE